MEKNIKINQNMQYIPPVDYVPFESESEYEEKGKEWGLFGSVAKDFLWYKTKSSAYKVNVVGYQVHGLHQTAVIRFENGELSCIHPAYLKEMQSSHFRKGNQTEEEKAPDNYDAENKKKRKVSERAIAEPKQQKAPKKEVSSQKQTLILPLEKVRFLATVESFDVKYNVHTDEEDEVILLKDVRVTGKEALEIGRAWCGYGKKLKDMGLKEGDVFAFDAKVVKKKFDKECIYKINNPSQIKHME